MSPFKPLRLLGSASSLCLAVAATPAGAMMINPNGTGQVLIYPYYTVNKHQQTLFTLSNQTAAGKAVQITFREGFNARPVYRTNVFLGANQTWAANVFALGDAGASSDGVGITSDSAACAQTTITSVTGTTKNGIPYHAFDAFAFTGGSVDSGPTGDDRLREGYIEVIELGEIEGDTLTAITPRQNPVPRCDAVIPVIAHASDLAPPRGGLAGTAAVINVAQGIYFAADPTAIDGFRAQAIVPPAIADLGMAGDEHLDAVSASFPVNGAYANATYPKSRSIDAVSALFMASRLMGEVDITHSANAATDWVLTFPTKHFYVDGHDDTVSSAPFETTFKSGASPVHSTYFTYSRDGFDLVSNWCGFNECPPVNHPIGTQTQIVSFSTDLTSTVSDVFGSNLMVPMPVSRELAGETTLQFTGALGGSNEGFTLIGLPVLGFQAIEYTNGNVGGVLANYSGTSRLRAIATCNSPTNCH